MELKPKVDSINVTIDENDLVIVRTTPGADITISDVRTTFFWAVEQVKPKKLDAIIIGSPGISFDAESRDFFRSNEFQQHLNLYALVVKNFGHRLFVDLIFRLSKAKMEYKIFTSEDLGLKWLRDKKLKA